MGLRDFLSVIRPNPDLIGRMDVRRDDIEPEKLDAYDAKVRRARAYLTERNLKVRPICRMLSEK